MPQEALPLRKEEDDGGGEYALAKVAKEQTELAEDAPAQVAVEEVPPPPPPPR